MLCIAGGSQSQETQCSWKEASEFFVKPPRRQAPSPWQSKQLSAPDTFSFFVHVKCWCHSYKRKSKWLPTPRAMQISETLWYLMLPWCVFTCIFFSWEVNAQKHTERGNASQGIFSRQHLSPTTLGGELTNISNSILRKHHTPNAPRSFSPHK